jgi:hypothetical protein
VPPGAGESPVKYHSCGVVALTPHRDPGGGQGLVGSLTGAVASQTVTEAPNGPLRPNGNRPERVWARRGLDCEANRPSRDESRAK